MTVTEYLQQTKYNYGGEIWPLGQIIRDLQAKGISDRGISLYIMGLQTSNKQKEGKP